MLPTIEWRDGVVVIIDQRKLPGVEEYVDARTYDEVAPDDVAVRNPAFDVTPARYVSAFVTDRGVFKAPHTETLSGLK